MVGRVLLCTHVDQRKGRTFDICLPATVADKLLDLCIRHPGLARPPLEGGQPHRLELLPQLLFLLGFSRCSDRPLVGDNQVDECRRIVGSQRGNLVNHLRDGVVRDRGCNEQL